MSTLRVHRIALGLTQQELGDIVGLSESTISLIERGLRTPSFGKALKIAEALDIRVEALEQTPT